MSSQIPIRPVQGGGGGGQPYSPISENIPQADLSGFAAAANNINKLRTSFKLIYLHDVLR